jgi:uncharacterized protein YndB with AHSA1/START domain
VIQIDREVVIARKPEVVFDYLADVTHFAHWQPAIERAEQVTPGPTARGTQFKLVLRGPTGPTEILGEVVEFDRPTTLAIRSLSGPAGIRATCALSPDGADAAGTRLRLTTTIELQGFLRFAEGRARQIVERELPAAVTALAARIEAEA